MESKFSILKKHYREYFKDSFPKERLDDVVEQAMCIKEETAAIMKAMEEYAALKAQPGAVWVKASIDRLPLHKAFWNMPGGCNNNECYFPVRIDGNKYRVGEIFDERQKGASEPVYMFVINGEDYYEKDFHRIEWLDESAAGESDAVEFAEWCANNYQWEYDPTSDEYRWLEANNFYTTAELYELFKQQKEK